MTDRQDNREPTVTEEDPSSHKVDQKENKQKESKPKNRLQAKPYSVRHDASENQLMLAEDFIDELALDDFDTALVSFCAEILQSSESLLPCLLPRLELVIAVNDQKYKLLGSHWSYVYTERERLVALGFSTAKVTKFERFRRALLGLCNVPPMNCRALVVAAIHMFLGELGKANLARVLGANLTTGHLEEISGVPEPTIRAQIKRLKLTNVPSHSRDLAEYLRVKSALADLTKKISVFHKELQKMLGADYEAPDTLPCKAKSDCTIQKKNSASTNGQIDLPLSLGAENE